MIAVMAIAATASFAQVGGRIGMNFASLTNADGLSSRLGMHIGAVYNVELANDISLQPGIYYSQRNWKLNDAYLGKRILTNMGLPDDWAGMAGSVLGDDATNKIGNHYFEVPVLVKYNLDLTSDITIDPHVGPYFAVGLMGKMKDQEKPKVKTFSEKTLNEEGEGKVLGLGYKNFDMGLELGCGATFFESVYFGLDYQIGLRELNSKGKVASRNGNFMITFGVWMN